MNAADLFDETARDVARAFDREVDVDALAEYVDAQKILARLLAWNGPSVLYHSSPPRHRESIATRGLIASDAGEGYFADGPGLDANRDVQAVYTSTTPNAWGRILGVASKLDVWEIDAVGLTIEPDPLIRDSGPVDLRTGEPTQLHWRILEDVPSDALRLIRRGR